MPKDLKNENKLVRLWASAAVLIRHLDRDLAQICDRKSGYWRNPDIWSDESIKSLGIRLTDVQERYRQLLLTR